MRSQQADKDNRPRTPVLRRSSLQGTSILEGVARLRARAAETDERLVLQWLQGDEESFEELYARYTESIRGLLSSRFPNLRHDVEDVLQEVWYQASRSLQRFRNEARFATWLHAVALNVARNCARSIARQERRRWCKPAVLDREAEERRVVLFLDLERGLRTVDHPVRASLLLNQVCGFTHREIARACAVHEGTSKKRSYLAVRAMRRYLADEA